MNDVVKLLSSRQTLVGVLVLALVAQMPHAQHVFYRVGQDASWFGVMQSWFAAIALELAVLVFVVRSNVRVSWAFAAFSVSINLMYYHDAITPYVAPLLLSAGLPVAIALYSHEVAHDDERAHDAHSDDRVHSAQRTLPKVGNPRGAVYELQSTYETHIVQEGAPRGCAQGAQDDDDWFERALTLRAEGQTYAQIARVVGRHHSTVSRRLRAV